MNESPYDLDLKGAIERVKKAGAQRVLVQLPDGLKPRVPEVKAAFEKALPDVELSFWAGTAYGACDVPVHVERLGVDLILHFGHAQWR